MPSNAGVSTIDISNDIWSLVDTIAWCSGDEIRDTTIFKKFQDISFHGQIMVVHYDKLEGLPRPEHDYFVFVDMVDLFYNLQDMYLRHVGAESQMYILLTKCIMKIVCVMDQEDMLVNLQKLGI